MSISAFKTVLRDRVHACGTLARAAEELKVSSGYISDVLADHRQPGKKLLKAMSWKRVVTYEPK